MTAQPGDHGGSAGAEALFSKFTLGPVELPNRLVLAPMTRNFSPGGIPGPDVRDYYRRRAAGGFGLVMTEATYIDHPTSGRGTRVPRLDAGTVPAWRAVTEAVHDEGARIFAQLWHCGMLISETRFPDPSVPTIGPSGIELDGTVAGEPMREQDIDDVIEGFASSAAAAQAAGFDGVELHAGHGYLIDQFFWGRTNLRTDRFGGSLEARSRFGAEIVRACRARIGDMPISLRFSQWKIHHYDARLAATPKELAAFLQPLVDAGVDLMHCSTRRFWEPAFAGDDRTLAAWTKSLTGLPTVTVGSIGMADVSGELVGTASRGQLEQLIALMERGDFDLVAVGRAAISSPDWPRLVAQDRLDQARPYDRQTTSTVLF